MNSTQCVSFYTCFFYSQALVNVPAISERTLRRDIEKAEVSTGPEIQVIRITCLYLAELIIIMAL